MSLVWVETGRWDFLRCEVERDVAKHREETSGLWRCLSCGYAKGEILTAKEEKQNPNQEVSPS